MDEIQGQEVFIEIITNIVALLIAGGLGAIFRFLTTREEMPVYDRLLWTMAWVALMVHVVYPLFKIEIPFPVSYALMYLLGTFCVRVWWYKDK